MATNPKELPEGIVRIHNKDYRTVAFRVNEFRKEHPDYAITTDLVMQDDEKVIMKATISKERADAWEKTVLATGYAEEVRSATTINRTSALEVAETSAIGRALAALGYAGTEYASADEVAGAISQQTQQQMWADNRAFMDAFEKHYESIQAIRAFLAEENFSAAKEAMEEIPNEDKLALNRAWTKGGAFNPRETKQIKWWSNDFEKTRNDV